MTEMNQQQLLKYRLLTWDRHIKNEVKLIMIVSAQLSPSLGQWCYITTLEQT